MLLSLLLGWRTSLLLLLLLLLRDAFSCAAVSFKGIGLLLLLSLLLGWRTSLLPLLELSMAVFFFCAVSEFNKSSKGGADGIGFDGSFEW